jgi:hypothetical protein
MLGGNQPWKNMHSAGLDRKIVKSTTKRLTTIFHHPQPPAFRTVVRSEFFQPDHAMGDAVNGFVVDLRSHVIEQEHGSVALSEIVLQRSYLPSIAKRALREQPYLRKAIQNDALWLEALHYLEDACCGFAEFEVGRVQKTLLLLFVEKVFGR